MAISMLGLIVDNCGFASGALCKKNNEFVPAVPAAVVINGAPVPPMAMIGFSGDPALYKYAVLPSLIDSGTYNLSGSVSPVGTTVYLSVAANMTLEEILYAIKETEPLASMVSNEADGTFLFEEIFKDQYGYYFVWFPCPGDYSSATQAKLEVTDTLIEEPVKQMSSATLDIQCTPCTTCGGTGQVEAYGDCPDCETIPCDSCTGGIVDGTTCTVCGGTGHIQPECPTCEGTGRVSSGTMACIACSGTGCENGYTSWTGTISGECPSGIETLYLSKGEYTEIGDLEQRVIATTTPQQPMALNQQAQFSFSATGSAGKHTVWGVSDVTGEIIVVDTDVTFYADTGSDGEDNPCLAGDTLILMADGSEKRLDKLEANDIVMTDNGVPARVLNVARGYWMPHHTLYHFEDGTILDEISEHRFFNVEQGFWQKLYKWNIGEHAKRYDGTEVALVRVERVEEEAECFGLWTTNGQHIANGLLGGEAVANRPFLAEATFDEAADMIMSLSEIEIEQMFYGGVL